MGARQQAEAMELRVNIAVVDAGGNLIAFNRMDGARPGSAATAQTKAQAAALYLQATGPLKDANGQPDLLLNLSLQNAASANKSVASSLYGGIPIWVDEQVIGAVGVGGARGEQDAKVAEAGIALFLSDLGTNRSTEE